MEQYKSYVTQWGDVRQIWEPGLYVTQSYQARYGQQPTTQQQASQEWYGYDIDAAINAVKKAFDLK